MRKSLIVICSLVVIATLTSAYIIKYSTGHAGTTGSPGENDCAQCHTAGPLSPFWMVNFQPTLSLNTYIPGQTYTVSLSTLCNGTGGGDMGIGCEILNGISSLSSDAGVMTSTLVNTKFITATNGRKNVTHFTPTGGNIFQTGRIYNWQFTWVAPSTDSAVFYMSCTRGIVNTNPLDETVASNTMVLTKNTSTQIKENTRSSLELTVFPNPTSDNFKLSYSLQNNSKVKIELTDLQGKQIAIISDENQAKGIHSFKYELPEIEKGVYFIKLSLNDKTETSRLIIIQ